jgi:hypothetical protein
LGERYLQSTEVEILAMSALIVKDMRLTDYERYAP